jgi:hypothetical protein
MSETLLLWFKSANTARVEKAIITQNRVSEYLDFDDDIDIRLWQSNC